MDNSNAVSLTFSRSVPLAPELLGVLACPIDHADLVYDEQEKTLACTQCLRIFPVENGIPNMLVNEKKESETQ